MTAIMRKPYNYILSGIYNAAAVEHGICQVLVSHDLLLKQDNSEKEQRIDAGLNG